MARVRVAALLLLLLASGCSTAAPRECGRVSLTADRTILHPGESVAIRVAFTNCGSAPFLVRPSGECFEPQNLDVTIQERGGSRYDFAQGSEAPREWLVPPDGRVACSMPPGAQDAGTRLPPGGALEADYSWNGTALRRVSVIGSTGSSSADALERLPAGNVTLSAQVLVGGQRISATADLALDSPVRNATRLLVVDDEEGQSAACAAASLGPEGLSVRGLPMDEYALLVRPWGRYVAWSPDGGRVAAPWDENLTLLSVAPSGADLWVNGTRLAPGESVTLRAAGHTLLARNEGEVPARQGAGCGA